MSHNPERKQKDCLNCNAEVHGRFCHLCGQENVEPKESFWHLVTHFVYDITHFDGKFFSTLKYLLFKPGFLPKEYIRGKRMSYLNPIKMYVFISAFFFIFFFSIFHVDNIKTNENKKKNAAETKEAIIEQKANLDSILADKDTPQFLRNISAKQAENLANDLKRLQTDTTNLEELNYYKSGGTNIQLGFDNTIYNTRKDYEASQTALPKGERDNWIARQIKLRKFELSEAYGNNTDEILKKLLEKFLHTFSQILFVSLPIFALLLKLLYIRKRNYYYAEHAIFSIILYCAMFVFIFLLTASNRLDDKPYLHWLRYLTVPTAIYIVWYNYKALRNFYQQSRGKTILKFSILLLLSTIMMAILFSIFFVFSLFTI